MNKRNIKKELSLPGKMESGIAGDLTWEKKHGHAGAVTLGRVKGHAISEGWKPIYEKTSHVTTQTGCTRMTFAYSDPKDEYTLTIEEFYGQTQYDNCFGIIVSKKPPVQL